VTSVALCAATALAAPARERIAVIDLGPAPGPAPGAATSPQGASIRQRLDTALAAAGLEPVTGDGIAEALSGRDVERDAIQLAAEIARAQRAFGELACDEVTAAAHQAIGIAAARQAAGRAVPELARAWILVLLCADRENQLDAAFRAAHQLRALGGSPEVPASVWAKYPEIDAIMDRELVTIEIESEVPGAAIWVDFRKVGVSPLRIELPAGDHVLAAVAGDRRGWAAGTAVRRQKSVRIPLYDPAGPWADVARRVAGWNGRPPAPDELAWLLGRVQARVAIVRHGDAIEAWGQIGRSEAPRRLGTGSGSGDGVAAIAGGDASRAIDSVVALVAERIRTWNERAPDPDRPLLVEDRDDRDGDRGGRADRPTKWWVYAAIVGAAVVGGAFIVANDGTSDRQRVELRFP
jgi:PEGA domain